MTKQPVIEDSDLVDKAKAGDAAAFEQLVRKYQLEVRSFLRRRIHNDAAADDLSQEVFLSALGAIQTIRKSASVKSWLLSIARFKMIDFLRSKNRVNGNSMDLEIALQDESVRRMVDGQDNSDVIQALQQCVNALRPNAREIVNRYYFESVAARTIADETQQKPNAIRMTLLRIRRALAKCIKKRMGDNFQI